MANAYRFLGAPAKRYFKYIDAEKGGMLVAETFGVYTMTPTELGLPVPPDSQWMEVPAHEEAETAAELPKKQDKPAGKPAPSEKGE